MTDHLPHLVLNVPRHILLTSNQRLHWAERSRRTRQLRGLAKYTARAKGPREPFAQRMRLVVTVDYAPLARNRDAHNLMPTLKACVDGIVSAGWLTDDSDAYLVGPDMRPSSVPCPAAYAVTLNFTFTPEPGASA